MKRQKIKCYLAGWFEPYKNFKDWRDYVKKELENHDIEFFDPRLDSRQNAICEFVGDDSKGILECEILFYWCTNSAGDSGSSAECGIAYNKIPIIIGVDPGKVKIVPQFINGLATVVIIGLKNAVEYLKILSQHGASFEGRIKAVTEITEII